MPPRADPEPGQAAQTSWGSVCLHHFSHVVLTQLGRLCFCPHRDLQSPAAGRGCLALSQLFSSNLTFVTVVSCLSRLPFSKRGEARVLVTNCSYKRGPKRICPPRDWRPVAWSERGRQRKEKRRKTWSRVAYDGSLAHAAVSSRIRPRTFHFISAPGDPRGWQSGEDGAAALRSAIRRPDCFCGTFHHATARDELSSPTRACERCSAQARRRADGLDVSRPPDPLALSEWPHAIGQCVLVRLPGGGGGCI